MRILLRKYYVFKNCKIGLKLFGFLFCAFLLSIPITLSVCLYQWGINQVGIYVNRDGIDDSTYQTSFLNQENWLAFMNDSGLASYELNTNRALCEMLNCFDLSKCSPNFKVYIYPNTGGEITSVTYAKILSSIRRSSLFTENPEEACLFIPNLDTLNRDIHSPEFVPMVADQLARLPYWHRLPGKSTNHANQPGYSLRPGLNHLIFIFYAGTWSDYLENELHMPLGYAMLAKASISTAAYRGNFDIALPLFYSAHREENTILSCLSSESGTEQMLKRSSSFYEKRPVLLSFKGKRYVFGIGSATRSSLHHLHNGHDIILVTTCRHGTEWQFHADSRCAIDQVEYDRYDYNELLYNSTFCLIPRGRRLGTYRFLEALQAGCIPVVLSNDWVMPFSEIIDWRRAVIRVDERLLLTLPSLLRGLTNLKVAQLHEQVAFLWNTYFSSVDSIILTTFEIIRDRVAGNGHGYAVWNSPPGGLILSPRDSVSDCDLPLSRSPLHCNTDPNRSRFTMVIPIREHLCQEYKKRLAAYSHTILRSPSLSKVLIIWQCRVPPPASLGFNEHLANGSVRVEFVLPDERRQSNSPGASWTHNNPFPSPTSRFQVFSEIETSAVFTFTLDVNITIEQLEYAFSTWRQYPNRLVGFLTHWDRSTRQWYYSRDMHRDLQQRSSYSGVLLNAAFYHRYYHLLFWRLMPGKLLDVVDIFSDCEDILLNALIGHMTQLPPVKILSLQNTDSLLWHLGYGHSISGYQSHRSTCLQAVSQHLVDALSTATRSVFYSSCQHNLNLAVDTNQTPVVVHNPIGSNSSDPRSYLYMPLFHSSLAFQPTR